MKEVHVAMKRSHYFERYRTKLLPAIQSKCEEFILFGYKDVTEDHFWEYMIRKKWKKYKEDRFLHELVNDILSVKMGDYMHYATMEAFKDSQKNNVTNIDSFKDLFR